MITKQIYFILALIFMGVLGTKVIATDIPLLSFKVKLTNKNSFDCKDVVINLDVKKIKKKYPDFNANNFTVFSGEVEIPSQTNDYNGDSIPEEIIFLMDLKVNEKKDLLIKYSKQGKLAHTYTKRTQAELSHKFGGIWVDRKYQGGEFKNVNYFRVPAEHTDHSFFIRYEGPGWESDKIGYRFYLDWRNAIDIFGKKTNQMVLQNVGQDGFESYHNPADWGMDNFKVGKSLGIGSIALWKNDKVNMVSETDSILSKIALNGNLESMVETIYYGWKVGREKHKLVSQLSIYGGSRMTKHHVVLDGSDALFCTGLIKDEKAHIIYPLNETKGWTYFATWGKQSLANDNLGIAIIMHSKSMKILTKDSLSHIIVLKPEKGKLDYFFTAAWEQESDGIKTAEQFQDYLEKIIKELDNPVSVEF